MAWISGMLDMRGEDRPPPVQDAREHRNALLGVYLGTDLGIRPRFKVTKCDLESVLAVSRYPGPGKWEAKATD